MQVGGRGIGGDVSDVAWADERLFHRWYRSPPGASPDDQLPHRPGSTLMPLDMRRVRLRVSLWSRAYRVNSACRGRVGQGTDERVQEVSDRVDFGAGVRRDSTALTEAAPPMPSCQEVTGGSRHAHTWLQR